MAIKVSTGLRNSMLVDDSLAAALNGGFINIYSGTAPTSADNAIGSSGSNVLLCTISVNGDGTGLALASSASNGVVEKVSAAVWEGEVLATGTATFYRFVGSSDTGALSTTEPRIQGTVGIVNADLNLSSVSLVDGATQTIDYYSIAFPTL